jgi:hypothetical protein
MKKIIIITSILAIAGIGIGIGFMLLQGKEEKTDGIMSGYMKLLQQNIKSKTFYFADTNANIIEYSGYDGMNDFYLDTSVVQKDNKYGIINRKEEVLINYGDYDEITRVEKNNYCLDRFVVKDNHSKYGVIDRNGKNIIPCQYDNMQILDYGRGIKYGNSFRDYKFLFRASDKSGNYSYFTSEGVKLFESNKPELIKLESSLLNESYDDIFLIGNAYYNGNTGEKLYEVSETIDYDMRLNVLAEIDRPAAQRGVSIPASSYNYTYYLLDKSGKKLKEIKLRETKMTFANHLNEDVYPAGDKYVIVNRDSIYGDENGQHIVYDDSGNEVYTTSYPIRGGVEDINGNVYFVEFIYSDTIVTLRFLKEDFTVIKEDQAPKYSVTPGISPYVEVKSGLSPYIFVYVDAGGYTAYDFNGNVVMKNIEVSTPDSRIAMLAKQLDGSYLNKIVWQIVCSRDCTASLELTENQKLGPILNNDNVIIEEAGAGSQADRHIYKITNLKSKKVSFEFNKTQYIRSLNNIPVIVLSDGYYDYNGKKILDMESGSVDIINVA